MKTHDTAVIGQDKDTDQIVFLKTYEYKSQEAEAQQDLKEVIDAGLIWTITSIKNIKLVKDEDEEDEDF